MGFGGWQSCYPIQWGGGTTPIESALEALRAGVGKGHAPETDGVEWRWREARAIGIAIALCMSERAFAQFEPKFATSGIALYREMYGLDGYGDQEVRDRANDLESDTDDFGEAHILARLQEIDPRFSLQSRDWTQSDTTIFGRNFGDWAGNAPFDLDYGRNETLYPNYSNFMEFVVVLNTTGEFPNDIDLAAVAKAKAFLDDELPAWVNYEIGGEVGFTLDVSCLDWARFG